jgi:hypothetical protein
VTSIGSRYTRNVRDHEDELRAEVARLAEENSRLRLESQRALNPLAAAEKLSSRINHLPKIEDSNSGDLAMHAELEIEVVRNVLISAIDDFATSISQLRRQLTVMAPVAELDRRVRNDRRGKSHSNLALEQKQQVQSIDLTGEPEQVRKNGKRNNRTNEDTKLAKEA